MENNEKNEAFKSTKVAEEGRESRFCLKKSQFTQIWSEVSFQAQGISVLPVFIRPKAKLSLYVKSQFLKTAVDQTQSRHLKLDYKVFFICIHI